MGKRARDKRAQVKDLCRRLNYREDEFGELRHKVTKAEARRQFIRRTAHQIIEAELIDAITKQAVEEIQALEDQEFLRRIDQILESTCPATTSP